MRLLVAEDDPRHAAAMRERLAGLPLDLVWVSEADGARRALAAERFAAGVFDVLLERLASGLEVLAEARAAGCAMPALVVTGVPADWIANRSHALDAGYLVKLGDWLDHVERFGCRIAGPSGLYRLIAREVEALARAHGLSARETELLGLLATDRERGEILEALGIRENTLKTHARNLLDKLRAAWPAEPPRTLDDVVRELRRRADRA
jgi:DNA-binding NarL/FixJ family response regulator